MKYRDSLKKAYGDLVIDIEDLYLLESHQISNFPERIPKRELAAILHEYPSYKRFFEKKYPAIKLFLDEILSKYDKANNNDELNRFINDCLWEIGEWFIYTKYPEQYDKRAEFGWKIDVINEIVSLENKIVIDAGAGSGRVSFMVADLACQIFAVEPLPGFRQFIRRKAKSLNINNIYTLDGILQEIPLPDNFCDILITSRAIGWDLKPEMIEVERIVKPGGYAIHISGYSVNDADNLIHDDLISTNLNYTPKVYKESGGEKILYWKQIK